MVGFARRFFLMSLIAALALVTACGGDEGGGATAQLTRIIIAPDTLNVAPGSAVELSAEGRDQDDAPIAVAVTWSADGAIGVISADGVFVATTLTSTDDPATGQITATSGGVRATAEVTVIPGDVARVVIGAPAATDLTSLAPMQQVQFTAVGEDEWGNQRGAGRVAITPTWSVIGGVGSIDGNGLLTCQQAGSGHVVAAFNGLTGVADITVVNPSGGSGDDGAEMVTVPAGDFTIGSPDGEDFGYDEMPQRTIYLDAYEIHKYEVTNAQYAAFLNAAQPSSIALSEWIALGTGDGYQMIQASGNTYTVQSGYEDYPVCYVTWYGANAYAAHYGLLLPTEAQWEKAARGSGDDRQYPWGDDWDAARPNAGQSYVAPSVVGSFAGDASPYGVLDMAGNVSEWCRDYYQSDWYEVMSGSNPYNSQRPGEIDHVIRGGNCGDIGFLAPVSYACRVAFRRTGSYLAIWWGTARELGFRCVASPQ